MRRATRRSLRDPEQSKTVADDATQRAANGPARLWRDACRDCGRRIYVDTDGDGGLLEIEMDGRTVHECPRNDAARAAYDAELAQLDASPRNAGPRMQRRSMGR